MKHLNILINNTDERLGNFDTKYKLNTWRLGYIIQMKHLETMINNTDEILGNYDK